jgi:hypothetical protein
MPVYYFNVRSGDNLRRDPAGTDLDDINMARDCAMRFAREVMATKIERDEVLGEEVFEISDTAGAVLATVPFVS